jgi:hypothetical protein
LKIPKGSSEDTKGVIRRYQRGHQKIPKWSSEDTKVVIRRYQSGHQKIPKWSSEAVIRKKDNDVQNTIHRKLRVEQHESHKTGVNSGTPER